jgi:hypothetical protein
MVMMRFMGVGEPEEFRCRVYGCDADEDDEERQRLAFVKSLAGEGVIDCPAYDGWVKALQGRGWLPETPDREPNPDGPGKVGRWRLTARGLAETEAIRAK